MLLFGLDKSVRGDQLMEGLDLRGPRRPLFFGQPAAPGWWGSATAFGRGS